LVCDQSVSIFFIKREKLLNPDTKSIQHVQSIVTHMLKLIQQMLRSIKYLIANYLQAYLSNKG